MPERNDQNQRVGENGLALQAGRDVIIQVGVTKSEAQAIALELWQAEGPRLAREAAEEAHVRAAEIREQAVEAIATENPAGIQQAANVDFQHALIGIQRDYARTGDHDLGDLLVRLLVDRSKETERNLPQIVLNEALGTVAKLTQDQISTLSIVFTIRYTGRLDTITPAKLAEYLNDVFDRFAGLQISMASMQHLEYAGCGTLGVASMSIIECFKMYYRGLFQTGVLPDVANGEVWKALADRKLVTQSVHDPALFQIAALSENVLEQKLQGVNDELANHARILLQQHTWPDDQIHQWLSQHCASMPHILDLWKSAHLGHFSLTSVGIAIAHANVKRNRPDFGDISTWIK